jgi:hypothetical protein
MAEGRIDVRIIPDALKVRTADISGES